jgi:hypothetical protein
LTAQSQPVSSCMWPLVEALSSAQNMLALGLGIIFGLGWFIQAWDAYPKDKWVFNFNRLWVLGRQLLLLPKASFTDEACQGLIRP